MKQKREIMIVLAFSVLPYQKKRLKELSKASKKTQSELAREALGLLFSQYQKMGY